MERIKVRVTLDEHARDLGLPRYMSEGASGMDLLAAVSENVQLEPGAIKLIPTGMHVELPPGYEAQVRPRSGLALKHGITIVNAPGTIDADYRGEIGVILANLGKEALVIKRGMRIAQMVVQAVVRAELILADELNGTERGHGGFGHTGHH